MHRRRSAGPRSRLPSKRRPRLSPTSRPGSSQTSHPRRPTARLAAAAAVSVLGLAVAAPPAAGQQPAASQQSAASRQSAASQQSSAAGLTIYMQNLALVRAALDRAVEAGERTVRVDGLPSNIQPSTLLVLDPQATLLGAHGRRSYQSAEEGNAVSLALDLRVERRLDGLRLAYLTGGMSWSPSYAMVVARDDRSARIDGYATVANNSGTTYRDASVQLLAGTVNVQASTGRARRMMVEASAFADEAAAQAPSLSQQAFSGYHLYDVDVPLTLHAGSQRRIRLMGAGSVPVAREYVLPGQINYYQEMREPQRQEAFIRYRVRRPEGTSFADLPLPGGTVRIFQPDDQGRLQLLGAAGIPNTPAREELLLTVGRAFDIGGTRTQTDYERPESDVYESAWRVELINRSDERVVVQVIDQIQGDWEILESSHEAQRLSATRVRFDVPVPADGEATLAYRIRAER